MTDVERLKTLLQRVPGVEAKRTVLVRLREAQAAEKRSQQGEDLKKAIRKCRECDLGRKRLNAVPFTGPTHGEADLVIVGEAPGENEDIKGEPFIGRSGRKLDLLLEQSGTHRSRVFICNTLCCRPPENRDPKPEELASCLPNFTAQLEIADVPVGIALGGYAYANVMGEARSSVKVGDVAGIPTWRRNMIWIPTYHPAYSLRQAWAGSEIRKAIELGLALRKGTMRPPIPPWQQVEVDGSQVSGLDKAVEKKGWALVHSKTLGQQIVIVDPMHRDRGPEKLPEKIAHLPQYELEELMAMGMLGKGMGGWNKKQLQAVHMVKHEFGGKVVLT
jgi:DNA polymerase